ncbi:replication protein A 70 kDa DNA-binding subunit-like, partial [Musca vetustissima]|uniref:replication protein A 70 kDa DNA-binding subunit-like n=1 Tax=Musca vetustissima TaxID=27455 RepID=UPI002AB65A92
MANFKICPVVNLSNTSANCSIKVRLVGKGYLRSIRTGGGKFFKMELQDASGVIDATSYGDKFFDMLEVGKVFLIRNFEVKNAHEEYNNLNHQYEIKFTSSTQIDQWSDEGVPEITYNFVEISQVANVGFDLIGVCHNVGEIQPCGQRQKRLLTLVDRSMAAVDVEVWNEEAAKFDNNQHPVVIVKTGRYNEYFRTVSTNNALIIDPDIEKANVLKSWYSKGGSANISSNLN